MLESQIEMPVVRAAEAAGYFVRKVSWVGSRNAPDRLFARADRGLVFVEFKAPGKAPNLGQSLEHQAMRRAGIETHVCDSVDAAMRVLWLR